MNARCIDDEQAPNAEKAATGEGTMRRNLFISTAVRFTTLASVAIAVQGFAAIAVQGFAAIAVQGFAAIAVQGFAPTAEAKDGRPSICRYKASDIGTIVGRGPSSEAAFEDAATQCFERRSRLQQARRGGMDEDTGLAIIDVCANIRCS